MDHKPVATAELTTELTAKESLRSQQSQTRQEDGDSIQETLRAAGVDNDPNHTDVPCLTLRMWVIGLAFCLIGSGVNTLYTFRYPSVSLSQSAIQFLAYPIGKAWEYALPDWSITILGRKLSLNPGPFNHKENILIYILANLSFLTRLSADVLTEQRVFYGYKAGWGFEFLITLATILFGLALAGATKSIVVDPPDLIWPGVLGNTALNAALHRKEVVVEESKWQASRYKFFLLAMCASFCWYWFPDFIFPALSYFTWICWMAPNNAVVNQVFGMKSGMGLIPITFDWAQIAYIGSPLVVPTWVTMNVLASLVLWIFIVCPALYYSNTWYSAYLPFQSNSVFDNHGKVYNVSRVINKADDFTFAFDKFEAYSDIYLPVTYALNTFGLAFATISALFIWLLLEKRDHLWRIIKSFRGQREQPQKDSADHAKQVSVWWYGVLALLALGVAIFACEFYKVQLRWYGVILAMAVAAIFYIPLAMVYALTNIKIQIDVFCRIIAGYLWEGRVLANIWFFDLGYISVIKGLAFSQDLKLGVYCGIPSRTLLLVQLVGLLIGSISQVAVLNWALTSISGICTLQGPNGFTCPFSRTHFNTTLIWGALGPRRFFAPGALYRSLFWFFLVGAALPVAAWTLRRRFPNQKWLKAWHVPTFLGGLNFIPPASGVNYGSWAALGLLVGWWVRRRDREWWTRYNFVLSAAMDCSTALAGIVIFFAVFWSGAAGRFGWWGTTVYQETCDWKGCSYLTVPNGTSFGR